MRACQNGPCMLVQDGCSLGDLSTFLLLCDNCTPNNAYFLVRVIPFTHMWSLSHAHDKSLLPFVGVLFCLTIQMVCWGITVMAARSATTPNSYSHFPRSLPSWEVRPWSDIQMPSFTAFMGSLPLF